MSTHILFATRRSCNAVGAMQRWGFKASDLEQQIACEKGRLNPNRSHLRNLNAELKRVRTQAKRATTRFERAQRDLDWS